MAVEQLPGKTLVPIHEYQSNDVKANSLPDQQVQGKSEHSAKEPFQSFYAISQKGELERYKDAQSLPVHLGDLYQERYRVMVKLGHGGGSTVWLAVDEHQNSSYVALKFLAPGPKDELTIHQLIREKEVSLKRKRDGHLDEIEVHNGEKYVLSLLDHFTVTNENGDYLVLVSEVLVPFHKLRQNQIAKLPLKKILFQLVQGLSFLHSKKVTHGDLHVGNIGFRLPTHQSGMKDLHKLEQPDITPLIPDENSGNLNLSHYPKYLVGTNTFVDFVQKEIKPKNALSSATLQIIDLSHSYEGRATTFPATHCWIWGPEFVVPKVTKLDIPRAGGRRSDIWAAACTMFTFVYPKRNKLFEYSDSSFESYLWEIERKIGPFPCEWRLPELDHPVINAKREPNTPGFVDPEMTPDEFWESLEEAYTGPWSVEEIQGFLTLIRDMLNLDPLWRPTINSIVKDKWFDDVRELC